MYNFLFLTHTITYFFITLLRYKKKNAPHLYFPSSPQEMVLSFNHGDNGFVIKIGCSSMLKAFHIGYWAWKM